MKYLFIFLILLHPFTSLAKESQFEDIIKCIPFRDSVLDSEETPKNPGDVISLAEKYCQKGSKMHIDDIPEWWKPYVIYNVCDMKYSVHVERFGTKEEPLASVICLYEGRIVYN